MVRTRKSTQPKGRGERHSAAWGKRLSMRLSLALSTTLILATGVAFGQEAPRVSGSFSREVTALMTHPRAHTGQTVKVIVQYKQTLKADSLARVQSAGGRLSRSLDVVHAAAYSVPANSLATLANDPEVAFVSVDHPLKAMDDYTDAAMNVSSVWNAGYNGSGIGVAVIDSGINDSHPDLWDSTESYSRVVYHQDFTGTVVSSNWGRTVYDTYGHGTHVAGIIAGNGYLSNGRYAGVAPAVSLIDLKVLDGNGAGSDSEVIAAIQQAIKLQNKYNIQVINLSLGRGIFESYAQDPLCQAVESAWKAGIVVVVAAGNYGRVSINGSNGYGTVAAPGNDPLVLTVGATKSNGSASAAAETLASFSSKGPTTYDHIVKPDLVAPGNDIVSLAAPGATLESAYPAELVTGSDGNNDYFT